MNALASLSESARKIALDRFRLLQLHLGGAPANWPRLPRRSIGHRREIRADGLIVQPYRHQSRL
jgi:hypothetical protein